MLFNFGLSLCFPNTVVGVTWCIWLLKFASTYGAPGCESTNTKLEILSLGLELFRQLSKFYRSDFGRICRKSIVIEAMGFLMMILMLMGVSDPECRRITFRDFLKI